MDSPTSQPPAPAPDCFFGNAEIRVERDGVAISVPANTVWSNRSQAHADMLADILSRAPLPEDLLAVWAEVNRKLAAGEPL